VSATSPPPRYNGHASTAACPPRHRRHVTAASSPPSPLRHHHRVPATPALPHRHHHQSIISPCPRHHLDERTPGITSRAGGVNERRVAGWGCEGTSPYLMSHELPPLTPCVSPTDQDNETSTTSLLHERSQHQRQSRQPSLTSCMVSPPCPPPSPIQISHGGPASPLHAPTFVIIFFFKLFNYLYYIIIYNNNNNSLLANCGSCG
jgi:hypothetical protein